MALELKITRSYPHYDNNLWFVDRQHKVKLLLATRTHKRDRGSLVRLARKLMTSLGGRWYDKMDINEKKPHSIRLAS